MDSTLDRSIRLTAATQHGVITRRQALAMGLTEKMIRQQVGSGLWLRMRQGVYRLVGYEETRLAKMWAVTGALPAVLSHQSAAELHDLKLTPINQVVVTVPLRCTNRFRDIVVHQSIDLVREFITEISGLPVTTIPRTIMDLAAVLRPTPLTVVVESAIVDRKVTLGELVDHHALLGRKGKPGTRRLREVLEVVGPEVVRSESALELRMMQLLEDVGCPLPVQQFVLTWRTKTVGRVDLAYPDHRLLIELDGRRWHTTVAAFEADRRRDNLAQLAGWRVLRFTWEDVDRNPAGVIRIVNEALSPRKVLAT